MQKRRAEYSQDKVYNKKEVQDAFSKIGALADVPPKVKNELINGAWKYLNQIHGSHQKDVFLKIMTDKICYNIIGKVSFYERATDYDLDSEITMIENNVKAVLLNLVQDGGHDSVKMKMRQGIEAEYPADMKALKKEAAYWRNAYYDAKNRVRVENELLEALRTFRGLEMGELFNATQYVTNDFKNTLGELKRIQTRGNIRLNESGMKYSVIKDGSQRASRTFDNRAEAEAYVKFILINRERTTPSPGCYTCQLYKMQILYNWGKGQRGRFGAFCHSF